MAEKLHTPSKRKKKADSISDTSSEVSGSTAPTEEADDEDDAATTATSVDDGLPHPRVRPPPPYHTICISKDSLTQFPQPFESRREFFVRTSNEWQEILMTSLRWKNIQPESLTIKEIKTKAFELSEEKWWDCREEITALEEEQEAAGIQEVVSLAERGDAGAAGGRRR